MRQRSEAGFTLIEMIVAFAVAGLLLGVLVEALGLGAAGTERMAYASDAAILAESALDPLGVLSPLTDGDVADLERGPYHLHVTVRRYDGAPQAAGYLALYRLNATVAWREGARERSLTLSTLRLGPSG